MKNLRVVKFLTLACGALLLLVQNCGAFLRVAYDTTSLQSGNNGTIHIGPVSGGHNLPGGPTTIGENFSINGTTPVSISMLGAYDAGLAAWAGNVYVGVYDQVGDLLASVTFNNSTPGTTAPGGPGTSFKFQSIAPIDLDPGATYTLVVSGSGTASNPYWYSASAHSPGTSPFQANTGGGLISPYDGFWATSGGTLSDPTLGPNGISSSGSGNFGWGTFVFYPVPEAQTFAVVGAALLGLIYVGRGWFLRRRTA